jgi:arylsulfatase A-like enzyme
VKNTPWEGGVRAVGFVWSPLIPSTRRGQIMDSLMDISDWLPTLYEAAGLFLSFLVYENGFFFQKSDKLI